MSVGNGKQLDVERWNEHDTVCAVCGDDIRTDDEFVWEPEPAFGPRARVTVHPGCTIRNGYRPRWAA